MELKQVFRPFRNVLSLAAPALMIGAGAAASVPEGPACQVELQGYDETRTVYGGRQRIRIQADSACESQSGGTRDLRQVTLTLERDSKRIARLQSHSALYSPRFDRLLLSGTYGPTESGCIGNVDSLTLDFKSNLIRAPRGLYLSISSPRARRCVR